MQGKTYQSLTKKEREHIVFRLQHYWTRDQDDPERWIFRTTVSNADEITIAFVTEGKILKAVGNCPVSGCSICKSIRNKLNGTVP